MDVSFPQWYNGDKYPPTDSGLLYDYNMLIGGVQIVQERKERVQGLKEGGRGGLRRSERWREGAT